MALRGMKQNRSAGRFAWLSIPILVLAATANAQDRGLRPTFIKVDPETQAQNGMEHWDVAAAERLVASRFRLFADGDRAWTSMRMVGDNIIAQSNTGIGERDPVYGFSDPIEQVPHGFQSFGIPLFWAAPRSEWVQYLVEGVESLQNATGEPPGWTVMWNGDIFGRPKDLNAADGLVGSLLSGLVSTEDGACTDHSQMLGGAEIDAGFQLLPGSNCPVTWSNGGTEWLGDRPVPGDSWIEQFNTLGADFEFNRWQVPDELKDQTRFMGNNFSTYGHFNDYNATVLTKFGDVVPGGSGSTSRQGWPLGLDVYFDAFTFTVPTVANAKFWGGLIVNNSEALYGVAHDYDSLYIGMGPWPGREQDGDQYVLTELGAWVSAESSDPNGPSCAAVDPVPLLINYCGGFDAGDPDGFERGAHGIVILKSPIGDLRNKLFTRAGPFNMPSHPLAGDTITFNHAVNWNFGNWGDIWNQGSERQRFGIMSSTSENVLDGTACADFFSNSTRWRTFRSNTWPDAPTQCNYGGWVPGDWHYVSGRPLGAGDGPDTLYMGYMCGPFDGGGCVEAWADSTWQGWSSNAFGNLGQFTLGPFRLEAGDTTEMMLAMYSGKDSVSFEGFTQGIVDFYIGFFAGPEAAPRVTIQQVDVGAGVGTGEAAEVTLAWDDAAEDYVDPFMLKIADDIDDAPPGSDFAIIRDANPGISDRIRARAADNLERLLVFRSCDGGATFDADGDCVQDEAFDESGGSIAPGFQAFAQLQGDASGDFPNSFTDGNIDAGISYLYSIIGETKGFTEIVVVDPNASVDTIIDTGVTPEDTTIVFNCGIEACEVDSLVVAPALLNPLSRSAADPNVALVYVPASVTAGGSAANVEFMDMDATGRSTTPFDIVLTSAGLRENMFSAEFGNRFTITEEIEDATGALTSTTVLVEDIARTVANAGDPEGETVISSVSYSRDDGVAVTLNEATLISEVSAGGTTTRVWEIGPDDLDPDARFASGFALLEETGSGTLPLMVSGKLEPDLATPGAFIANPIYPGFLVDADQTLAEGFDDQAWFSEGDTINPQVEPTLALDEDESVFIPIQGVTSGDIVLTFTDSVFGSLSPFRLDNSSFEDPTTVDAVFDQSLAGRSGTTAVTDDEAVGLVAAELGLDPAEVTLVAANIPFAVDNTNFDRGNAQLAMVDRGEITKILGLGRDTLSVTVDPDQWIPEDEVFVIESMNLFQTASTAGGDGAILVDGSGNPLRETVRRITARLVLTCPGTANTTCNPVTNQGTGGWVGVTPTDELHLNLFSPFQTVSEYVFVTNAAVGGEDVMTAGASIVAQMDSIRAVPNPYLFFSDFETSSEDRRIMFTHLPPDGEIRIYTISGNFVQEIDWQPSDLAGNGDLYYDLTTREGNDLGAGLFIYVVTATDPATGDEVKKMGKFVVIR